MGIGMGIETETDRVQLLLFSMTFNVVALVSYKSRLYDGILV